MDGTIGTDELAQFESQNSAGGLFLRYASGRLRHFWNRQVLGLFGAIVIGLNQSPGLGLVIAALILSGEALDCWILRGLLRQVRRDGLLPAYRRRAIFGACVQMASLLVGLGLSQLSASGTEVHFFMAALLTGIALNCGPARPYFPVAVDAKLSLAALSGVALLIHPLSDARTTAGDAYFLAAATVILAVTVILFIRQVERAFARQQGLERSMAERTSDLRRSKEDLARTGAINQRLALAARHANDAIVFLDAENRYEWVNEAFTRITGYSAEQAVGQFPGDLLNAPETSPEAIAKIQAAHRDLTELRVEVFNRGREGRGYWVDSSIIPILDEEGQLVVSLAIERDITEAKQREADLARSREAAEAAAQAKSRFLANMSHEIRTPLNGVIGVAELLAETRLTHSQRDYVDTVLDSGRALLRMINDILDLSKLQSGKVQVEEEPFDLRAVLDGVMRLLHPVAAKKGLTLALDLPDDLGPDWARLRGDAGKLRQILFNLVGNALKFTEVGNVTVTVARHEGRHVIRVTDTGIGIDPGSLSSIFDSFTQADDSITRRFGGTGLGLTISAMLAGQMGGEISVQSRMGIGSSFALSVPFQPGLPVSPVPARPPAPTRGPDTAWVNLLVAEDNQTNMMILRKVLAGQVGRLIEAQDGLSAVQAWMDEDPDLILMDVSMPVMDGLTAAREIRARERDLHRPRCPILALTASSHLEIEEACRAAGFDGFLVKPLLREDLLAAIAHHSARKSAPAEVARA